MGMRRNPFRGLVDTISEVNRTTQQWMTGQEGGGSSEERRRSHVDAWVPTTDIFARDKDLIIRLDVPGVDLEDVEITFAQGNLIVSGERRTDPEVERDSFYVRERSWGFFRRSITLPEGTSESDIEANLDNGLLEILIRNGADAEQPRRISIGGPR